MIRQFPVILAISSLILIVDPKLALMVSGLAIIYLILYFTVNKLKLIGKERIKFNEMRFKTLGEVFGGIKEVKVNGLEDIYIEKYKQPSKLLLRLIH